MMSMGGPRGHPPSMHADLQAGFHDGLAHGMHPHPPPPPPPTSSLARGPRGPMMGAGGAAAAADPWAAEFMRGGMQHGPNGPQARCVLFFFFWEVFLVVYIVCVYKCGLEN